MTVQDMIVLADMWMTLSQTKEGQMPQTVVLLGKMTGREKDRYFRCTVLPTAPQRGGQEPWSEYVQRIADYVDFTEVDSMEMASAVMMEEATS